LEGGLWDNERKTAGERGELWGRVKRIRVRVGGKKKRKERNFLC